MSRRNFRIEIQNHTILAFKNGKYESNGQMINIPQDMINQSIINTHKLYNRNITSEFEKVKPNEEECKVLLIEGDCLDAGLILKKLGFKSAVLNMASAFNPGGGYLNGAGAQEEQLFRRTNLHMCLDMQKSSLYPIPRTGAIYTQDALVIKKSEIEGYEPLDSIETMNFIASAAHRCKVGDTVNVNKRIYLSKDIEEVTKQKVHTILRTGIIYGNNAIVLSAYGCGAYGNPAYHIANIFKNIIGEYKPYYKVIAFAIIDDKNAFANNKKGNVQIFSEVLKLNPISLNDIEKSA